MNKIYYISIKGKTLESRNLKELLARAVEQKRKSDRACMLQNLSRGQVTGVHPSGACITASGAGAF
ncbi:MAG TPA: hypothetical protein VMG30_13260 [Acidobacteriota bacterium]|nr:hypothetical protein [Acidobacteriota bacterium]